MSWTREHRNGNGARKSLRRSTRSLEVPLPSPSHTKGKVQERKLQARNLSTRGRRPASRLGLGFLGREKCEKDRGREDDDRRGLGPRRATAQPKSGRDERSETAR